MDNIQERAKPHGVCGIQHFLYADEVYHGLAQRWEKGVQFVRTTNYWQMDRGWNNLLTHNEETIIVKKQIQFMGRCQS